MKGTLTFRPKQFFVRICPRIAVGWVKYATWHSLRMCYEQGKLGWCHSVNKGTLPLGRKQFFIRISPRISVVWYKYETWHSLRMRYVQCKLGLNPWAMKGTLLLRLKQFFVHISPRIAVGCVKYATTILSHNDTSAYSISTILQTCSNYSVLTIIINLQNRRLNT
jgi:hypothetical protein